MAYDLKLAPEPEHGVMPAISIAALILIVVAVVVFLVNPRETAILKLDKVDIYAPHTEIKADKRSVKQVGLANTSEDDLYVVATVTMTNKLRLPIFISDTTMTLTNANGSSEVATGVSPKYYQQIESSLPAMTSLLGAAIYDGDQLDPGTTHTGNVLVLFPGLTEAAWKGRKLAVLTIGLRNQAPQTITIPAQ
jgi:hypothetical protein